MSQSETAQRLIAEQGTMFHEAMGCDLSNDTPQELFHWLIGSLLLAARINHGQAEEAGRALRETQFHKIETILSEDKWDLVAVLRENGYKRYDTVTSDYIIAAAELVRQRYDDDLRKLRDGAGDAEGILEAVKEVKGIGDVGADIFAREAQLVWDPLYPRADGPALDAAAELGLPTDVEALRDLAGDRARFVRLLAALTRAALDGADPAVADAR